LEILESVIHILLILITLRNEYFIHSEEQLEKYHKEVKDMFAVNLQQDCGLENAT
jgi:hypothetical protein